MLDWTADIYPDLFKKLKQFKLMINLSVVEACSMFSFIFFFNFVRKFKISNLIWVDLMLRNQAFAAVSRICEIGIYAICSTPFLGNII
mgnify:CR=1 FL=1